MEFANESRLVDSEYHGIEHWKQVESNGILLASRTRADISVVRLFAIFHDCKRMDDGHDAEHGLRGAEFARASREKGIFQLDDSRFEKLYHACRFHTEERTSGDVTIDTCYDADRLDLGRVGFRLDPSKMATATGKKLARMSVDEQVSVFRMREWLDRFR